MIFVYEDNSYLRIVVVGKTTAVLGPSTRASMMRLLLGFFILMTWFLEPGSTEIPLVERDIVLFLKWSVTNSPFFMSCWGRMSDMRINRPAGSGLFDTWSNNCSIDPTIPKDCCFILTFLHVMSFLFISCPAPICLLGTGIGITAKAFPLRIIFLSLIHIWRCRR